ncbi:hypothetical protein JCM10213_008903 [Rhodosporidiobolus nylandii]
MHGFTTLPIALLLAAGAQGVAAQDSQPAGQGSSSSHQWQPSGSAQGNTSAGASATASASSAISTSSGSSTNPLIPNSISAKCSAFLTSLNSDTSISSCTAPLLNALSSFTPSSSASWSQSSNEVSAALSALCNEDTASSCHDAALRQTLTQFSGNCTAELSARQEAVLGLYDALYVLEPLRTAVCETDAAGGWCLADIVSGHMPAGSTGANATAVDSAAMQSASSAATAVATGVPSQPANASSSASAQAANGTASYNSTQQYKSNAVSSSYEPEIPAPPALYIQMSTAVKRLFRRQNGGASWSEGSSSAAWSSSSAAWSPSSAAASASASASGNATAGAGNSTAAEQPQEAKVDAFGNYTLPSLLPSPSVWSASSLPFLLLSPNMSSTVLCSSCTKSILSTYVAWESRMPYALGLANSPMLGGQGSLWTGVGEKCGAGFLEATARQAGQENLTGAGSALRVGGAAVALVAAVVAMVM